MQCNRNRFPHQNGGLKIMQVWKKIRIHKSRQAKIDIRVNARLLILSKRGRTRGRKRKGYIDVKRARWAYRGFWGFVS